MKEFPHYWICDACAKERGGAWETGHVATMCAGKCQYCEGKNQRKGEPLAPWVDYDWSESIEATKRARLARD